MKIYKKTISVVSLFMVGILLFSGPIQLSNSLSNSISLIRMTVQGPARTIYLLNCYIMKLTDPNWEETAGAAAGTAQKKEKEQNQNRTAELIFFTLNTFIITGRKFIIALLAAFIGISIFGIKRLYGRYDSENSSRIKRYLRFILGFVDPRQKCIEVMSERYDMNPLAMYAGQAGKSPRFNLNRLQRGFFYAKKTINPKPETLNSKQIRNTKYEIRNKLK